MGRPAVPASCRLWPEPLSQSRRFSNSPGSMPSPSARGRIVISFGSRPRRSNRSMLGPGVQPNLDAVPRGGLTPVAPVVAASRHFSWRPQLPSPGVWASHLGDGASSPYGSTVRPGSLRSVLLSNQLCLWGTRARQTHFGRWRKHQGPRGAPRRYSGVGNVAVEMGSVRFWRAGRS